MKSIKSKINSRFGELKWNLGDTIKSSQDISPKVLAKLLKRLRENVRIYDPWPTKRSEMDLEKLRGFVIRNILEGFQSVGSIASRNPQISWYNPIRLYTRSITWNSLNRYYSGSNVNYRYGSYGWSSTKVPRREKKEVL